MTGSVLVGLTMVGLVMVGATACSTGDGRELARPDPSVTSTVLATASTVPTGPTVLAPTAPTDMTPDMTSGATAPVGEPVGFDSVAATVTTESGEVCELCLWVAATPEQRTRGLMGVTDLGAADGMIFRYPVATTTTFWMQNTPMPLSITFFDADGEYMDVFDMEPCTVDPCPRYATPGRFIDAIEFPQGTPTELGIGPGSVLAVSGLPCG